MSVRTNDSHGAHLLTRLRKATQGRNPRDIANTVPTAAGGKCA
ncbi:hypothetical protein L537_4351 [Bordetella hinzii 1277]|nr:hypothetical protein L537_4351 [Bordetella hinzii 1277]